MSAREAMPGDVRVVSDGTVAGTRVDVLCPTLGWVPLRHVQAVTIRAEVGGGLVSAWLEVSSISLDMVVPKGGAA